MSAWDDPQLRDLFFAGTPLIDVRSPVEFSEGSLPHSINFPIMNNEERVQVGTCYKQLGQAAAIKLGHDLISGKVKEERISNWLNFLVENPRAQVFCFRGGLRSQIACQWISEAGIKRSPIEGGYKRIRRFFLSQIEEAPLPQLLRLSGLTGSGKTETLKRIKNSIDLEKLANHRGSAFGDNGDQPSQISFENELSLSLMKINNYAVIEDESAVIGKLTIPRRLFHQMRNSPLVILRCDDDQRIQNIFREYVLPSSQEDILKSLDKISKRLGGVRFKEIQEMMKKSFAQEKELKNHSEWIRALLKSYYDPFYEKDLKRQSGHILFEGKSQEVMDFIRTKGLGPF